MHKENPDISTTLLYVILYSFIRACYMYAVMKATAYIVVDMSGLPLFMFPFVLDLRYTFISYSLLYNNYIFPNIYWYKVW